MAQQTHPSKLRTRFSDALDWFALAMERRFAIDVRALAVFRIALGALLIADLALRAQHLEAFYTDAGVLPRAALASDYSDPFSLHAISGEAWVVALLFLVAGVVAFAMLVGYRTRIATIISWVLLVSLHIRNPMVLNGGDVLFRMLLFWAMFLPLGEQWSVDARRIDRDRSSVTTIATMAVLLQVVVMYLTNAAHKTKGDLWLNGEAVVYIFQLDQFTILLGNVLADQYMLLRAFTYLWVALVVLSPLLVLLTGIPRAVLASLFVGMHVGMLFTMRLGLFPLIVVAALIPFYQAVVWDAVTDAASRLGFTNATRRWLERLERIKPNVRIPDVPTLQIPDALTQGRVLFSTIIPWIFLILIVTSSAQSAGYANVPDPAEPVLDSTMTDQNWRMFAPNPLRTDGWYVVPGELENGSEVDVLHRTRVDWERPENVADAYENARWRKYLGNVWSADNENHRSYLANHLCGRWNRQHDTNVSTVTLYYMSQQSQPYNETTPINKQKLHEHDCSGELLQ